MTTTPNRYQQIGIMLAVCIANLLAVMPTRAATVSWTGASGTDTNWSTAGNWSGGTPSGNDIKFFSAGGAGSTNVVNTVVDASVTINSLQFANTNLAIPPTNAHTLYIASGQTLSVTGTGGLIAGTLTDASNTNYIYNSIAGPGALTVNNGSAIVLADQGRFANGNLSQRATLDLAGLDTFTASVSRVGVGTTIGGGTNNAQNTTGTILLARTNTITAAFAGNYNLTGSPITNSIEVGLNNGNNGGINYLYLGQNNVINCDSIGVGKAKTVSTLLFNPAFTNSNPTAVFRGASGGSSRVTFWSIGDMADSGSSSGSASGTNDFTGGTVDILVNTMSLGRDRSTPNIGAGATRGTLIFTAGTIDVNTLLIGNQFFTNPTNTNPMIGVVNVISSNATLVVNTSLVLGNTVSSTSLAATNTSGTLNINGGNVRAAVITSGVKSTNSIINMNGGRLNLITTAGTAALPITSIAATNAQFALAVAANRTNVTVSSLVTGGSTNLIDIASIIGLASFPTQMTLIKYSGAIGGAGFNFGLGAIPPGAAASLVDNSGNSSVDLLITAGPVPQGLKVWTGAVNTNWDILVTTNWTDPNAVLPVYQDGDFVRFDDSASGSTSVNLTTALSPGSVTVSNITKSYTFSGPGSIIGAGGLVKQGSGTATILGAQTYTGGTAIAAGVLQLGDGAANNGSVAGNVTNDASLVVASASAQAMANTITGAGKLTKSGSGTLTLSGANTYSGGTLVSAGTLQVGDGSTSGSITGDVTNNAVLAFSRSDNIVFGNVISGNGIVTKAGSGTTILSGANSYAGGTTNLAGTLVLSNNTAAGTGSVTYFGGSVQVAPGVTISNAFVAGNSTATDGMMDCSAAGTGTWAGNVSVVGSSQFRPSGIAGTLALSGTGALGGGFLIVPRGTVQFVGNANFSSTANGCAFGRNTSGNSAFVTLRDNAAVSTGPLSLGGGQATGGRVELTIQDTASLSTGTTNFDIHNSTVAAAFTVVHLNGGTMTVGGQIKSQTGGTQLSTNNFNGGKLRASKDNAAFLPASAGLVSNVRNGGVVIDDNGFSIAIALPLRHSAIPGDNATDGGLTKFGSGTLALNAINTYNGPTLVTAGTLGGSGTIAGPVTVQPGATLAPGNSIGTLTITNDLTFQAGSTNLMEVNLDSLTNDQIVGISNLTYSGTLVISNTGIQAITNGSAFKLFDAATYTGAFAGIVPTIPDTGLIWNTNTLVTDGTLRVTTASSVPTTPTNLVFSVSGGNLTLSWPSNYVGWTLQAQTNPLTQGLYTNWVDVPGSETTNLVVIPTSTGAPAAFFRMRLLP